MRGWSLRRVAALFLPFLLPLAFCGVARADAPGRAGWLAETRGTVWRVEADPGEQPEWVSAERNRPLTTGDRLATDRDARAELRIGAVTVRMGAGSDLSVLRLDDERIVLQLNGGAVTAQVRSPEAARDFEIDTGEGRFLPLNAGTYRIDRQDATSTASAWDGPLRFDAADSTLVLDPGRAAEFWSENGVTHYTWSGVPADGLTDWTRAEQRREAAAPRYVSPEMTGAEELDRYGQWQSAPEYGTVWIPSQVVAGWAPYRYGHWAWVSPWGWTWVDDAPWGFAPFHYGRWAWWHERWCWVPGAYVARPVYAPALVGWVGGPQVNISITVGSAPAVGWVPLAPRDVYYPWYQMPSRHWRVVNPHVPDHYYRPGQMPTGPIAYVNRTVPGAVTVVPTDVLRHRQPVAPVARPVDPRTVREWTQHPGVVHAPPPPPPAQKPGERGAPSRGPVGVPPATVPGGTKPPAVRAEPGRPPEMPGARPSPGVRGAVPAPAAERDREHGPEVVTPGVSRHEPTPTGRPPQVAPPAPVPHGEGPARVDPRTGRPPEAGQDRGSAAAHGRPPEAPPRGEGRNEGRGDVRNEGRNESRNEGRNEGRNEDRGGPKPQPVHQPTHEHGHPPADAEHGAQRAPGEPPRPEGVRPQAGAVPIAGQPPRAESREEEHRQRPRDPRESGSSGPRTQTP